MMSKLKLTGFLLLLLFTIKGQNKNDQFIDADNIDLHTYICSDIDGKKQATVADTLTVSPNPFDSVTVIQFTISNNDTIWLNVLSSTGNTVKTYYNGAFLSSGTYSYTFKGGTLPNGIYFVRLKVNSITHTVKIIKGSNTVGLTKNVTIGNVNIFPNPSSSIINIFDEYNQLQNSTIEIKNYLGQTVYTSPITSQINLSDLSAGIYFLTMQNSYLTKTIKVIKQ